MYDDSFDPYFDDDRVVEARREAALDRFDEAAETCEDCGERWDPGYHAATRVDPAYCEHEECPRCGGQPVRDWPF